MAYNATMPSPAHCCVISKYLQIYYALQIITLRDNNCIQNVHFRGEFSQNYRNNEAVNRVCFVAKLHLILHNGEKIMLEYDDGLIIILSIQ